MERYSKRESPGSSVEEHCPSKTPVVGSNPSQGVGCLCSHTKQQQQQYKMANLSIVDRAARISNKSPRGAKLLLKLSEASTGTEVQSALDEFDLAFGVQTPSV